MPELELLTSGWGLIEGPRCDPDNNLYFSDVPNGGVRRLLRNGEIELVIPKRRGVGGMLFHADGGLVVSGRNIQHVSGPAAAPDIRVLFDPGLPGFNDMHADADGRVYVGALRRDPFDENSAHTPGELYRINLDGTVDEVYGEVQLTNGIGFSPDGRRLYHSDSDPGRVWVSDVAPGAATTGAATAGASPDGTRTDDIRPVVTNRREFVAESDAPDGLAVDTEGGVWVALANGGRVQRYTPDGKPDLAISVPDPMVTSVSFGGADMRDLYIATGGRTSAGGCIYKTRTEQAGVPTPLARI